jgi:hypothetical protein
MYNFSIYDASGNANEYKNIVKATYSENGSLHEIIGDNLFTHCYPVNRVLHLYSGKTAYTISPETISIIQVDIVG